jgi:hypothetical protein
MKYQKHEDWNSLMTQIKPIKSEIDDTKDLGLWVEMMRRYYAIHVGLFSVDYQSTKSALEAYLTWYNEKNSN